MATLKNVLIILPRQLGDVLLGTSLARALKASVPGVRISWLAHPMARQILQDNPVVDEAFYSKGEFKKEIALIQTLRAKHFDAVIDAIALPRTAVFGKLIGARRRISFRTRWSRNIFYTDLIERERLDDNYLGYSRLYLLEPLGITKSSYEHTSVDPILPILEADKKKARTVVDDVISKSACKTFVTLSPTHRRPVRRWPTEKFVELGERFAKAGIAVVWLWGPGEEEFVRGMHDALSKSLQKQNLTAALSYFPPLLTLRETAAFCGLSVGFVGNSNGLSHIAVAGGAKTVQLHGPTLARAWTHPDPAMHCGIESNCAAACLGKNTCQNEAGRCLEKLSVDKVWNESKNLFELESL